MSNANAFLRHALATLAYRCGKAIRNASPAFAGFSPQAGSNTPVQILSHISDLLDWSLRICQGEAVWRSAAPQDWPSEVARFYRSLRCLDDLLADGAGIDAIAGRLFQGPIADALTHTGQLAMLRRMAGEPVRGENYFVAGISIGCVGEDQPDPVKAF